MQRRQLAGMGLGLADEARVLGGERDLTCDGRRHLDGLGRPFAVVPPHEPQRADRVVFPADGDDELARGVHRYRTRRPGRLREHDLAALGAERGRRAVRDLVERRRQIRRGCERLGDGQQHLRALHVLALLGEAQCRVDGRTAGGGHLAQAGEMAGRKWAAPSEGGEQADADATGNERHRQHGANRLVGEPGAAGGRREGHGGERGRPACRQPLAEAADGTMGQRARGGGAREAEPRVQRQFAAVETEQPDRGGVGRNLRLRVGRQAAHDELEIEDIGGHAD